MAKEIDENMDFLSEVEIKTMRKDIAWLQSGGNEKERERLKRLKEGQEKQRKEEAERAKIEEEKRTAQEAQRRAAEERKKILETLKKKEEAQRIIKEKKTEEEQKMIEEEKKRVEEEERAREARKRKEGEEIGKRVEEEKRKIEEELKKAKEEIPEIPKISLEEEKIKIAEELRKLSEAKRPFDFKKEEFLAKLKPTEKAISIISKRERLIEEEIGKIEEKEKLAEPEREKREIEKKRWEMEEKRRRLEQERWPWDEEKRKIEKQIQELDLEFQEILKSEEKLKEKQREIFAAEERIRLEREKYNLKKVLEEIEENKKASAIRREEFYKNLVEIKDNLKTVLEKERKVEEDKRLIEEEEELITREEEKRKVEKERWEIEARRREIEKERWALEEEKRKIEIQIKRTEMHLQGLVERIGDIQERVKEIDSKLRPGEEKPSAGAELGAGPILHHPPKNFDGGEAEEITAEIKKAAERELKESEKKNEVPGEKEEIEIKEKPAEGKERIEEAKKRIEEAKERIEALKREEERKRLGEELKKREIETTEKPIETLKKEEMKKEGLILEKPRQEKDWGRLKKEWEELERERERSFARVKEKKEEAEKPPLPSLPLTIVRPLPGKPSFRERVGIRIIILVLILAILTGVVTFWYWYFTIRKPLSPPPPPIAECETNIDCPEGEICQAGSCVLLPPVIEIPSPLFSADDTVVLSVSSPGELQNLLLQEIQATLNIGQFKRVVIKNIRENKIFGLRDFFEALLIRVPEELYSKLENDFTLFVYAQSEGNRIGFAVRIKNSQGLADLLRSRESTMENDFQTFFELVGKTGPAIVPYFRNANNVRGYVGPNFRYQTLNRQDLGICYLIAEDYLAFTSSWKSMESTVTKLALYGKPLELTSELKLGSSGKEVELIQTWLKEEPVVYPEGKVTGYFGQLTQAAVIRFQEKYASEILAPQGFSKGTGIVDSYTRIKLNEMYGKSGIIPTVPEITTDLRYGDHGNEVKLLQTWLAKDQKIYPEGKISGWFGYATQRAVIRFQEKYASEILTPQGLSRGTGIVDALTRKKLNELYGNRR